ncbi:hypothetical protein QYE76_070904 [Lolium multiflorum]|uniref:Uncharacterized protein n=1 Tax=Lolium multiflorum TaxID=4521 RepID=A0AAD8SJT9_LOLMU|nr:hypothetical protein QYE76_070904 [Lolium multiflorum]
MLLVAGRDAGHEAVLDGAPARFVERSGVTEVCRELRYEEEASITRGGEEQLDKKLDVKLDVKLDMEFNMKTSHGRTREEREACARGDAVQRRRASRNSVPPDRRSQRSDRVPRRIIPENKNSADLMTWREYEALRNEMRREFRTQDDELRGSVQEISQKLDATNETVTKMQDQMTDIQQSLQVLTIAVDNLTQQQQPEEEDPEL